MLSIETRLKRLETFRKGANVGLIIKSDKLWECLFNEKIWSFETLESAEAFLKERTETIIIDDLETISIDK